MSDYHNKRHGSTDIRDGDVDNLGISWDYDDDPLDKAQRQAVFLYTPWMKDTNVHYHISLNREEARKLRDWLTDFVEDTKP